MSHFVVGVIVPKDSDYDVIEDVLAPYDENAEYDFKNCSEEIEKEYANNTLTMYRTNDLDLICEYSRNHKDIPDGNRYKHLYNSWNISDYAFRMTWEDYQHCFGWMYADKATMWADWKKMYWSK